MSQQTEEFQTYMPPQAVFESRLRRRNMWGRVWQGFYYFSILVAILALVSLFSNIINEAFGAIAVQNAIEPETLTDGRDLSELSNEELAQILLENANIRVLLRDNLSQVPSEEFTTAPMSEVLGDATMPDGVGAATIGDLTDEQLVQVMADNLSDAQLRNLVLVHVVEQEVVRSWPLTETLFNYEFTDADAARLEELEAEIEPLQAELDGIFADLEAEGVSRQIIFLLSELNRTGFRGQFDAGINALNPDQVGQDVIDNARATADRVLELRNQIGNLDSEADALRSKIQYVVANDFPDAEIIRFQSWLDSEFLTVPMSSTPAQAGIRTALLGSILMMIIVVLVSLPVGVGAAIYLQEYANDNFFNRVIETNVRNLAGVPSIIYGMLGLAIFVRVLEGITQGRTILSGALTLTLLILPIIIINAQEALRSVPNAIREASFGLGATKWQTIWRSVLPAAIPGILTGTILSVSRAVGETAPLIVVGASTFIITDPDGPFSQFTALPIQIYNWTARPQDQFRDIAAAAIIVLLLLMLSLNATAIIIRNRFSRRY